MTLTLILLVSYYSVSSIFCYDTVGNIFHILLGKKLVIFGEKKMFKAYDECQMLLHQESEFGQFRRRVKVHFNNSIFFRKLTRHKVFLQY